ncbi:hypothetical protein MMPV_005350 [Pyropia vietnamensis]
MESLLLVEPTNVDFPATKAPAGSVGDYSSAWLRLSSVSDTPVAFKVKTTKPSRYCVRPNHGVVMPTRGEVNVEVICLEPPAPTVGSGADSTPVVVCRDKFLIQATPATGAVSATELASGNGASLSPSFWSSVPAGGLLELKMKVSFAPPLPPGSAAEEPVAPTAAVAAAAAAAAATGVSAAATPPPPLMHPPGLSSLSPAVGSAHPAAPSQPSGAAPRSTPAVDDGEAAAAAAAAAEQERSRREAQLAATEARVADLEAQLNASVSERESLSQALISARSAAALAEAEAADATAARAAAEAAAAEREAVARVGSLTGEAGKGVAEEATAVAKNLGDKGGVVSASPGGGVSYLNAMLLCLMVMLLTKLFL